MAEESAEIVNENLKLVYEEVCKSYHSIDDFRAKLLGFLPLASGVGIFLLLGDSFSEAEKKDLVKPLLLPIGCFGFVVTIGLFFYELRGIQRCNILKSLGSRLEKALGIDGHFSTGAPELAGFIGATAAALVIYPAVLAAWTFVGLTFEPLHLSWAPPAPLAATVVFLGALILPLFLKLKPDERRNQSKAFADILESCRKAGAGNPKLEQFEARLQVQSKADRSPRPEDW